MNHDPLCPVSKWPAEYPRCQCGLIADVIAAAVQRVQSIPTAHFIFPSPLNAAAYKARIIAAIKGEQS